MKRNSPKPTRTISSSEYQQYDKAGLFFPNFNGMKQFSLLSGPGLLFLVSCAKEDKTMPELYGKAFFPLEVGRYVEYVVDSTVYTEIPKDTLYYQYKIKERIEEVFTDAQGHTNYRLNRYTKPFSFTQPYDTAASWKVKEAWLIKPEDLNIVQQENNVSFVKLIFPVQESATWDGHARNNLGKEMYRYEDVDALITIAQPSGTVQKKMLTIRQLTDTSNLIVYDQHFERYGMDIGLIFRENIHLESNTVVSGVPVYHRIEKGYKYKLSVFSYGKD